MTTTGIILVTASKTASNFTQLANVSAVHYCDPHTNTPPWKAYTHKSAPDTERVSYWLQTMWDISRLQSCSSQHGKYCNIALSLFTPCCLFHTVFAFLAISHPPFKQKSKVHLYSVFTCPLTATNYTRIAAGSSGSGIWNSRKPQFQYCACVAVLD